MRRSRGNRDGRPFEDDIAYLEAEAGRIELLLRLRDTEDDLDRELYDDEEGEVFPTGEASSPFDDGDRCNASQVLKLSRSRPGVRIPPLCMEDDTAPLPAERDEEALSRFLLREQHRHREFRRLLKRIVTLHDEYRSVSRSIVRRRRATRAVGRSLALDRMCEVFGLDATHREILLALAAPLLVPQLRTLFERLRSNPDRIELGKLVALFAPNARRSLVYRRCFTSASPLIRHDLVGLDGSDPVSEGDFLKCEVELPRRVFGSILGKGAIDESLLGFTHILRPAVDHERLVLPEGAWERIVALVRNQRSFLENLARWDLEKVVPYGRGVFILFSGPPGTGKTLTAHALGTHLGKPLIEVDAARIEDKSRSAEGAIRSVFREARLMDAIVFFDECDQVFRDRLYNGILTTMLTEMERFEGIAILATNAEGMLDEAVNRRIRLKVRFPSPTVAQRRRIWSVHLPDALPRADDVDVDDLAERFDLAGGYIKNAVLSAVQNALARDAEQPRVNQDDLASAARQQVRDRLRGKVERRVPRMALDRLVLAPEVEAQVRQALWTARHAEKVFKTWGLERTVARGRATTLLLMGPPGTGKSATAEAIAFELGRPLHVVNLAGVLSMWMGQTEKNIQDAFEDATDEQAVLVFDEADALFGGRQDGGLHARREVSLLLDEVERFEGVLIATTNLPELIDSAFERRFRHRIRFEAPGPEVREAIWRAHLPEELPLAGDVDLAKLARSFELTGGEIRNALVMAASEAACRGSDSLTMMDLDRACREAGEAHLGRRRMGFGCAATR